MKIKMIVFLCTSLLATQCFSQVPKGEKLPFKKLVLSQQFLSEGVSVADVNKDGKKDVLAGYFWFEAPGWKQHEIFPSLSISTNAGDSLAIPIESQIICFFQGPGWFFGFSNQIPGKPGKSTSTWSSHPSRFTSIARFGNELLYSFVGSKTRVGYISCCFHPGASNQK